MAMTLAAVKAEVENWYPPLLGKVIDADGEYPGQCVDLIHRFGIDLHGHGPTWGNGDALADNLIKNRGYARVSVSSTWQIGDVVSKWTGWYGGHVFIVLEDLGASVRYLDQNGTVGGAGDAWGFGQFPGQYGMAVLSRYPLAAEEAKNPARNVPRGIIAAMCALICTCALVLFLVPGAGGASAMQSSGNPLVEALGSGTAHTVVNYIGLAGLVASFFSIIYAYSRQLFALSRAGYLPKSLSVTNSRKSPTLALIVPGIVGFLLSLTGQGAMLLNMAVFGAALSYVLMMISHIVLRIREPELARPYRTPGGIVTTAFALVIAVLALVATFLVDIKAATGCLIVFALFMAYFGLYSRKRLVFASADEEFEAIADAEEGLS